MVRQCEILFGCVVLLCGLFVSTAISSQTGSGGAVEDYHPDTIWFAIYVLDVDDIDGAEQKFAANVFLKIRWIDETLAHSNSKPKHVPLKEIWHPRLLIANQDGVIRPSLDQLAQIDTDGTVIYRQRYVGQFSQPLRLCEFPFDQHDFAIQFIFANVSLNLKLLPDIIAEAENIIGGDIAAELSLADWEIIKSSAQASPYRIGKTDVVVPGFSFVFTAKRYFTFYFWQAVVPLVLIVMMSWAAFWINPAESGAQLGLAASSILTMIAQRFVLANFLPKLPYMTRMDYLSVSGMVMVFLALIEVVITSILAHSDRLALGKKIDQCSRILFPLVFAIIIYLALFANIPTCSPLRK